MVSEGRGAPLTADADDLRPSGGWADLPLGVLAELAKDRVPIQMRFAIVSEIPPGSGLSSSAALAVATAIAVLQPLGGRINAYALTRLCQRAENDFLGVPSGLMDQIAVVHGRRGEALFFNAGIEIFEPVALPADIAFLVVESGVERSLRAGGYGDRRQEAAEALRLARQRHPGLRSLADLESPEIEALGLPETLRRRARHIAGESHRVRLAIACLEADNVEALGQLMSTSHLSLARDYEVSTLELDALVKEAVEAGAAGARLLGAGFGGSIIAAVEAPRMEQVAEVLERDHRVHRVVAVDGALA
ncbi:MAG TPA: hypothetical protein VNV65_12620 [Candidatus Solibacter sp.]|jgi:galactokinase|nr:hypothetical protein [Candidatus Solibacter sp.]